MELSLSRSSISYAKNVFTGVFTQEESTEAIVPDAMPDILRLVDADAVAYIRSKEADNGRVTVSGVIASSVVYVSDGEEGIRHFCCEIPFSLSGQSEEIDRHTRITASIRICTVDAVLLNSRKVLVKAETSAELKCYQDTGDIFASKAEDEESVNLLILPAVADITAAVSVREKTFVLSDELTLPAGDPPIGEVLKVNSLLTVGDAKPVGNKAVFRGTCRTSLLYRAAGSNDTYSESFESEYSQIVEMDMELENAELQVIPMLTSAYYDHDVMSGGQEGRSVITELHAVAQCVASMQLSAPYIQDAYSTKYELELRKKELSCRSRTRQYDLGGVFMGTVEASPRPTRVLHTTVLTSPVTIKREDDKQKLSSRLTAKLIYLSDDGGVYAALHTIEASVTCETESVELEAQVRCSGEIYAMASAGVIELRIPAEFTVTEYEKLTLAAIDAISVEEEQAIDMLSYPSIIVHFAAPGETMWSMAKKYNSTPAMILEANALEPGESLCGRRLLITPQKR